jgi:hypothetical protein
MLKISFYIFLICNVFFTNAAVLLVEGKFQNKNVYVQNAIGQSGVGFCAREIKVNGHITTDETNSSAFEINLKSLQLNYGEDVLIEIIHSEECTPKILNIEDLKPKPTFEVLAMNITNTGLFLWNTVNEAGSLPYIIEQFRWNKWIPVGEVQGIGTIEKHEYSFQVTMHSGENKYRVRQKGLHSLTKVSSEVSVKSPTNKPSYAIPKNNKSIEFSYETAFEVYDAYGVIVKKGFGKQISTVNLNKGNYYLCYDNFVTEFKK